MRIEEIESHLRRTTIISNVISICVALVVAMSVGYGFYYNTKNTLSEHGEELRELKNEVNEIDTSMDNIQIFKGVSSEEINNLSDRVEKIDVRMDKIDDKLDRILMQTK